VCVRVRACVCVCVCVLKVHYESDTGVDKGAQWPGKKKELTLKDDISVIDILKISKIT